MILLSDPRIAAITSADDAEPLVDLRTYPRLRVDSRAADDTGVYAHVRRGLADRLAAAQQVLPDGVHLLLIEGYRPPDAQSAIFTGYRDELRRLHPSWPADRLHVETSKFVSPVDVAPHTTGGAVDLTLCTTDSTELDLGTPVDATPVASDNACYTGATNITAAATRHRRILIDALTSVGLVNYPTEWWHWSYGDRYWALTTGAPATRYGPC